MGVYLHIGVGFCVARSDGLGKAKASAVGRVTGTATRAFFIHVP